MKFGKVLKVSSENMPDEMHDLFLRYKELKKKIKAIPRAGGGNEAQASVSPEGSNTGSGSAAGDITAAVLSPEEQAFTTTLNEDLARFNRYFIDQEETAVIRLQALCDELAAAATAAGMHIPEVLLHAAHRADDAPAAATAAAAPPQPGPAPPPPPPAPAPPPQRPEQEPQPEQERPEQEPQPEQQRPAPHPGEQQQEEEEATPTTSGAAPAQQHHHHHRHHSHQHPHGASPSAHATSLQAVKARLVQFHGEMVLLLHWSLLNYAAVVKILKKHDKRTGVLLRAPYLANVLQQPFSSTTIMSRLAKRAEELIIASSQLAPAGQQHVDNAPPRPDPRPAAATAAAAAAAAGQEGEAGAAAGPAAAPAAAVAVGDGRGVPSASDASTLTCAAALDRDAPPGHTEPLVGRTMHALQTWANLRKNASTPSTVLAEVDQPSTHMPKRKAEGAADADAAGAPPIKAHKEGNDPTAAEA